MGVGLYMRSALRLAVLAISLTLPQTARAQNDAPYTDTDGSFFSTLADPQANQAAGPTRSSDKAISTVAPSERATDTKSPPAVAQVSAAAAAPSIPAPAYREQSLTDALLALGPIIWGMIAIGFAVAGILLWVVTPLPCALLGHRRSSKSVRFNDHEDRWVGNCKSCGVLLARDRQGAWRRAKPTWRSPEIVGRSEIMRWPIAEDPTEQVQAFEGQNVADLNGREFHSNSAAVPIEQRAQQIVSQLLEEVNERPVLAPGTRGALFSVVDELRARCATDEHTLCAEKISVRMQQLECAMQGGDEQEAKLVRRDLRSLAQEWVGNSSREI